MPNDDLFEFNTTIEENKHNPKLKPWKILIVDDDPDIHSLTKMVLSGYKFNERPLKIYSSYSGEEAINFLKSNSDIAIILLDVVMETDDAGLICVKRIREELKNLNTRIILRTGQPGQAPEHNIIVNYDINDYKAKTELTSSKLFTTVTTSLRSYNYIKTITQNKIGLENIINASSLLFEVQSFTLFAKGILKQLTSILSLDDDSLYINSSSLTAFKGTNKLNYKILAGTGSFAGNETKEIESALPKKVHDRLLEAITERKSIFTDRTFTGFFETKKGEQTLLYFQWTRTLTPMDKDLISIFSSNISVAFENISQNNNMIESQRKIIQTLSKLIDEVSRDNTFHIKTVTDISCLIAQKLGIEEEKIEIFKLATPMHDVGQITLRNILKKAGKLTEEEYDKIKAHTINGGLIFKNSPDEVMKCAGIISYQHHEKWDGSGYPHKLKEEEIDIFPRIFAIADVFDALTSDKFYRDAWPIDRVINHIKNEKGKHFDPIITDIFLDNINEIIKIKEESKLN